MTAIDPEAEHEAAGKAWTTKLQDNYPNGNGPKIPAHVGLRLAQILEPGQSTWTDYVSEAGAEFGTRSGRVVVIGAGLVVEVNFTESDSYPAGNKSTGFLTVRRATTISGITVEGEDSGVLAPRCYQNPGFVTVSFEHGADLKLPVSRAEHDVRAILKIIGTESGWIP